MKARGFIRSVVPFSATCVLFLCCAVQNEKPGTDVFIVAQERFYANQYAEAIDSFSRTDTTASVKDWWLAAANYEMADFYRNLEEDFRLYEITVLDTLKDQYPQQKEVAVLNALNRLTDPQVDVRARDEAIRTLGGVFGERKTAAMTSIYDRIFRPARFGPGTSGLRQALDELRDSDFPVGILGDLEAAVRLEESRESAGDELTPERPGHVEIKVPGSFLPEAEKSPLSFGCTTYYRLKSSYYYHRVLALCLPHAEDPRFRLLALTAHHQLGAGEECRFLLANIDSSRIGDDVEPFWPEILHEKLNVIRVQELVNSGDTASALKIWRRMVQHPDFARSYAVAETGVRPIGEDFRILDSYWEAARAYLMDGAIDELARSCQDAYGGYLCPLSLSYMFLGVHYVQNHASLRGDLTNRTELLTILDRGTVNYKESISPEYNPHVYLLLKARSFNMCKEYDRAGEIYNELVGVYPDMNVTRKMAQLVYTYLYGGDGKVSASN